MIIIAESDVEVECCGCTRRAVYICTVKQTSHCQQYSRTYCEIHTAELLRRAATILENHKDGPLHDWIEVEHLMTNVVITNHG